MNYKFWPDDEVVFTVVGGDIPCTILNRYTSDSENHPASPHNRYGVVTDKGVFHDVCEAELTLVKERGFL